MQQRILNFKRLLVNIIRYNQSYFFSLNWPLNSLKSISGFKFYGCHKSCCYEGLTAIVYLGKPCFFLCQGVGEKGAVTSQTIYSLYRRKQKRNRHNLKISANPTSASKIYFTNLFKTHSKVLHFLVFCVIFWSAYSQKQLGAIGQSKNFFFPKKCFCCLVGLYCEVFLEAQMINHDSFNNKQTLVSSVSLFYEINFQMFLIARALILSFLNFV